jgi:hypothetical protein
MEASMKFGVFWNVAFCSNVEVGRRFRGVYRIIRAMIALIMEAVRTSETLVNFNVTTRRYIPEVSKLPNYLYK